MPEGVACLRLPGAALDFAAATEPLRTVVRVRQRPAQKWRQSRSFEKCGRHAGSIQGSGQGQGQPCRAGHQCIRSYPNSGCSRAKPPIPASGQQRKSRSGPKSKRFAGRVGFPGGFASRDCLHLEERLAYQTIDHDKRIWRIGTAGKHLWKFRKRNFMNFRISSGCTK